MSPSGARRLRVRLAKIFRHRSGLRLLLLSALVGVVSGCGALVFYYATNAVDHLMLGRLGHYHLPVEGEAGRIATISSLSMDVRW
ncbi:MAG: hypothetical protein P8X63_00870, partial [Desulfuromonadaceae bacterium]